MHALQTRRPYSTFKVTAAFDPWKEIDGDLISPVPNDAPLQKPGFRTWPPHAAWYTVKPNPSWTGQNKQPLLWDQSRKSLKLHKDLLMDACNQNGATDEQKKLIMSMAMLVRALPLQNFLPTNFISCNTAEFFASRHVSLLFHQRCSGWCIHYILYSYYTT